MPGESKVWDYMVLFRDHPCPYCAKLVGKKGRDVTFEPDKCTCDKVNNNPLFPKTKWKCKCTFIPKGKLCQCGKIVSYDIISKRTSNLSFHLKTSHRLKLDETSNFKQSVLNFDNQPTKIVNESISKITATTSTNPSIVENIYFKEMIKGINDFLPLENQIVLKNTNYYRNQIPKIAEETKNKNKEEIKNVFQVLLQMKEK